MVRRRQRPDGDTVNAFSQAAVKHMTRVAPRASGRCRQEADQAYDLLLASHLDVNKLGFLSAIVFVIKASGGGRVDDGGPNRLAECR